MKTKKLRCYQCLKSELVKPEWYKCGLDLKERVSTNMCEYVELKYVRRKK